MGADACTSNYLCPDRRHVDLLDRRVGTIAKVALTGGNAVVIPGSNEAGPVALTHDSTCIYWVNSDGKEVRKAGQ